MTEEEQNTLSLVRAAAERGVPEAQALYGQMLLDGRLVERSPAAALHWFERAALGGDVMAINMVGRCLDQGWGVARSPRMAMKWFRKAAERGLDWGMYNLATLLVLGEHGVPKDRGEALYWLRKAVELGHVKSMNLLGGFYEDGWEVQQDRATARAYYRDAAVGGDFRGQFNYARLLAEEGDYGLLAYNGHPDAEWATRLTHRVFAALNSAQRMHAYLGRTLPGLLIDAGLDFVDGETDTMLARFGDPAFAFQFLTQEISGPGLVAAGLMTAEEHARARAVMSCESTVLSTVSLVAAWGRRRI